MLMVRPTTEEMLSRGRFADKVISQATESLAPFKRISNCHNSLVQYLNQILTVVLAKSGVAAISGGCGGVRASFPHAHTTRTTPGIWRMWHETKDNRARTEFPRRSNKALKYLTVIPCAFSGLLIFGDFFQLRLSPFHTRRFVVGVVPPMNLI